MIRLTVCTNSTRPINRLMSEGITTRRVVSIDNSLSFDIYARDRVRALDLLRGYDVSIEDRSIDVRISKIIHNRLGIVVGIVLVSIIVLVLSHITLDIAIIGASSEDMGTIESILEEHHVRRYSLKIRDTDVIEDDIVSALPNISFAKVYYMGGKLCVKTHRTLPSPPLENVTNAGIIANCDGIVTRIIATQGTPLVKVGDSVKVGDTLIAPYVIYGEGDEARRREVVPSGEVYARTYLEERVTLSDNNVFMVPSGRVKRRHSVLGRQPKSPYEQYRVTRESHRLFSLLPIAYDTYIYEELVEETLGIDDPKLMDYALKCAYYRLDERLFQGESVLNKWFFQKRLDNLYIISVYYEVEKLISGGSLE